MPKPAPAAKVLTTHATEPLKSTPKLYKISTSKSEAVKHCTVKSALPKKDVTKAAGSQATPRTVSHMTARPAGAQLGCTAMARCASTASLLPGAPSQDISRAASKQDITSATSGIPHKPRARRLVSFSRVRQSTAMLVLTVWSAVMRRYRHRFRQIWAVRGMALQ
jgi:hypothetical protein